MFCFKFLNPKCYPLDHGVINLPKQSHKLVDLLESLGSITWNVELQLVVLLAEFLHFASLIPPCGNCLAELTGVAVLQM